MRSVRAITLTAIFLLTLAGALAAEDNGRIYGVITTIDGDRFEGLIRWDKNEGSWVDVLDGSKELPRENIRKYSSTKRHDRSPSIKIFGVKIGGNDNIWNYLSSAQSGIRFGHLKSMEVVDDDAVLLVTKSGQKVTMKHGSTDIGEDIREIVIEDKKEGEIELVWDDIEKIEFQPSPVKHESVFGSRLYGKLTTRRGDEFTGFVCWDVDEIFESDILDGSDRKRKRKVKFGDITSIERYSSNGATVILKSKDEFLLRESNDVDDDNRGIIISDPGFGQVRVKWDEFDRIDFSDPPQPVRYGDFDGGKRLRGTVYTGDGESYSGQIRWDNDEEYSWEILDGEFRNLEFDIEFGLIKEIEKKSYRSCDVTVWDGRSFRLSGSNDVDEDNKGIFVTLDNEKGDEVEIEWDDFARVTFDHTR